MAISTTSYSPNGWVTIAGTSYRFKRYSGGGGDYTDCLTFTGETSEFTLKATNKCWNGTLEWSTDHTNWTTLTGTEAMQSVGKKLYLRGKGNTKFYNTSSYVGVRWNLSAKAGCSGNIQTLLDWESPPTSISTDSCYGSMFYGCTNLTTAPELLATTLARSCYSQMFHGCTNLTTAPELPATTLAESCYSNMFSGCTNLTTAPELPAITLAESCYGSMFVNCTNLTTAPNLPATTLADSCYDGMFKGCTSLTTAPALPATTLTGWCYQSMFSGCTNLTTAPSLPATTLVDYCYQYMFDGCTNLTTAPELPAITLAMSCYYNMFRGCTSLKISAVQTAEYKTPWRIPSSGTISSAVFEWNVNMLAGTGGTFTSDPSINTTYYGAWGTSGGGDYTDCLTFTGETSEFTLKATNKEWDGTLEWSTDHTNWTTLTGIEAMQSVGKKLYLRGKGNTKFYTSQGVRWQLSAKAGCSGNIQTLLDWESPPTSISTDNCYRNMFYGCTSLTTAPALPATTLADYCYNSMFRDCTSLISAPTLPATTLEWACYYHMFDGCTSLTSAPALPATTLANDCYSGMFEGCTNLTTAPSLPATTLAYYCYNSMFKGCTKLKLSTTQTTEYKTPWRIPSSGTISSESSGWNTDMLIGTGGTFTGNPSINTTYYGA